MTRATTTIEKGKGAAVAAATQRIVDNPTSILNTYVSGLLEQQQQRHHHNHGNNISDDSRRQ
jgi:hypothetical protein